MFNISPPIQVHYNEIKELLNVGDVDNLTNEAIYNLIVKIPCFIMSLRDKQIEALRKYKEAKLMYQKVSAEAFLSSDGKSVEVRKAAASLMQEVIDAEKELIDAEAEYERLKTMDSDWVELQQALKKIIDGRIKKQV